jgi:hypothetical protein
MSSKRNESKKDSQKDDAPPGSYVPGSWEVGSAPARSNKRDDKRVAKAQERLMPSDRMSKACNNIAVTRIAREEDGLSEHVSRWEQMRQMIELHRNKGEWLMVERKSTELIADIVRVESDILKQKTYDYKERGHEKQPRVILAPEEQSAYYARAQARREMGNLQGAVEDCTEALAMMDLLGVSKNARMRVNILLNRGKALHDLYRSAKDPNHLEGAMEDARACWAILQARKSKSEWEDEDTLLAEHTAINMLKLHVRKQLLSSSSALTRPLFSMHQRRDIEKELGLGPFTKQNYKCFECGLVSDEIRLCGGCKQIWFCDRACQRKAWKSNGHNRSDCDRAVKMAENRYLSDAVKSEIDTSFLSDDVCAIKLNTGEPCVIVRDPSTGRYFDALTDENGYFLPSEAEQAGLSPDVIELM